MLLERVPRNVVINLNQFSFFYSVVIYIIVFTSDVVFNLFCTSRIECVSSSDTLQIIHHLRGFNTRAESYSHCSIDASRDQMVDSRNTVCPVENKLVISFEIIIYLLSRDHVRETGATALGWLSILVASHFDTFLCRK